MPDIRPYLERLDSLLGPERTAEVLERHRRICTLHPVDRPPLVINVSDVPDWPRYDIDLAFNDRDMMLLNELRPIYGGALVGDDRLNTVRANLGVGIVASLFGCAIRLTHDAMPWVDALDDAEAIRRIVRAGVPDLEGGLWPRVAEYQDYFRARLGEYPNLRQGVRLSMCDMQGPFSIAHLVWGHNIYYAVVDEPELVAQFMEVVTETYLRFIAQERAAAQADAEFTEFIDMLAPGKVLIREDSATNLSAAMYERFCLPYVQRTLDAFPGSVHYCGAGHQFFDQVAACTNLLGMNFGNPERQDPACIRSLIDRGIVVFGWNLWPLDERLSSAPTGLSIGVSVRTVDEGKRLREAALAQAVP